MNLVSVNVFNVVPLLLSRKYVPEKCEIFVRSCLYFQGKAEISFTEKVEPVGELNRWFVVALRFPEAASDASLSILVSDTRVSGAELATISFDVSMLFSLGQVSLSIDKSCPPLKLAICNRALLSLIQDKILLNPLEAAYAFPQRKLVLREICGEVKFGCSLPESFFNVQLSRATNRLLGYTGLLKRAKVAQGLFPNDDTAVSNLFFACSVHITGIRGLEQVQRIIGSKTLSSPYVSVFVKSKRFPELMPIGRTNTEYRTADPIFGTNTNSHAAEHSYPSVDFSPDRFGRIAADGVTIETYIREGDSLQFFVYHERHSVYQGGVSNHLMCVGELKFEQIEASSYELQQRVALTSPSDPKLLCGELLVTSFFKSKPASNPFDAISETTEICDYDEYPNLLRIPCCWLQQMWDKVRLQIETLENMLVHIRKLRAESPPRCFKSSRDKTKLELAGLTTNLHQCEYSFSTLDDPAVTRSRYAFTTCGVPTALALGVDDTSFCLDSLQKQVSELHSQIGWTETFDLEEVSVKKKEIPYGNEIILAACNTSPPCNAPIFSMDGRCGSLQHYHRNSSRSSGADRRSAASSLRTAAASIASKLTGAVGNSPEGPEAKSASAKKVFQPLPWQRLVDLQCDLFLRETIVASQAVTPIASAFMSEALLAVARGPPDAIAWGEQMIRSGFLLGWESLISTYGKENGMLADVVGIVDYLNQYCSIICCVAESDEQETQPEVVETGKVTFAINVFFAEQEFRILFGSAEKINVPLSIVLFSQGVNETQSISNYTSRANAKQVQINKASVERLINYSLTLGPVVPDVVSQLNNLVENQREAEKEVEILLHADQAVRFLKGGRQIMCKSGKDRTAMAVTLEQSRLASSSTLMESIQTKDLANVMREFGVRLRIAEKNVGTKTYSFNAVQRRALPQEYRPPVSVIQDIATSISKRDS